MDLLANSFIFLKAQPEIHFISTLFACPPHPPPMHQASPVFLFYIMLVSFLCSELFLFESMLCLFQSSNLFHFGLCIWRNMHMLTEKFRSPFFFFFFLNKKSREAGIPAESRSYNTEVLTPTHKTDPNEQLQVYSRSNSLNLVALNAIGNQGCTHLASLTGSAYLFISVQVRGHRPLFGGRLGVCTNGGWRVTQLVSANSDDAQNSDRGSCVLCSLVNTTVGVI